MWKTKLKRECLWFVVTILGSSLLWYLVSCIFPEFWGHLKTSLIRLLSFDSGDAIRGRFEVIVYMDVLTLMFVYTLRFTSWAKRLVKGSHKNNRSN